MARYKLLSPLDLAELTNRDLVRPYSEPGFHRLHKRLLRSATADQEFRDIPLYGTPSSPLPNTAFCIVPVFLVSVETIIFTGIDDDTAAEIWDKWTEYINRHETPEFADDEDVAICFEDFLLKTFDNVADVVGDNDEEWRTCLSQCGFIDLVQDIIMDPDYKHLRLGQSCLHWAKDTMEMRLEELEKIQRSSRNRDEALSPGSQETSTEDGASITTYAVRA